MKQLLIIMMLMVAWTSTRDLQIAEYKYNVYKNSYEEACPDSSLEYNIYTDTYEYTH